MTKEVIVGLLVSLVLIALFFLIMFSNSMEEERRIDCYKQGGYVEDIDNEVWECNKDGKRLYLVVRREIVLQN